MNNDQHTCNYDIMVIYCSNKRMNANTRNCIFVHYDKNFLIIEKPY